MGSKTRTGFPLDFVLDNWWIFVKHKIYQILCKIHQISSPRTHILRIHTSKVYESTSIQYQISMNRYTFDIFIQYQSVLTNNVISRLLWIQIYVSINNTDLFIQLYIRTISYIIQNHGMRQHKFYIHAVRWRSHILHETRSAT